MIVQKNKIDKIILCQNRWKKQTFFNKVQPVVSGIMIFDFDFMKFDRNCSGSHPRPDPERGGARHQARPGTTTSYSSKVYESQVWARDTKNRPARHRSCSGEAAGYEFYPHI